MFLLAFSCKKDVTKEKNEVTFEFTAIDSLLNAAVSNNEIPGAVAYMSFNGHEILNRAYGYKNIEDESKMSPNSIFRIASMTKALTAVAILQLVEQGNLKLDDPLKDYLPEFSNPTILVDVLPDSTFTSIPAKNDITIHQLLTHTSGLSYGFQDEKYNALIIKNNISEGFCPDSRTSFENAKKIAAIPLLVEPGEKNIYGLSYEVLGTVIEQVTGLRYDDYIVKNILNPLGMDNSYFLIPKEHRYRLPDVYEPGENGIGLVPTTYSDTEYPILEFREFYAGGSDLSCTASDYNKFLMMIENKGTLNNNRILGEKYIEMMLAPQTNFNDGDSSQGFAAWVVNDKGAKNGLRPKGSYDFGGFFDTYCWVDPKNNFTAILLLQMYPTNAHDIHWKFQKSVYKIMNDSEKD